MQGVQARHLGVAKVPLDDDQKIHIALLVEIAEGEGALQVRAHEIVGEHLSNSFNEMSENHVERGIRRR
jgi:hypothetical protein